MKRSAKMLGVLLLSCGGQLDSRVGVGGETHFLITCGDECGAGLSCIEGVCTRHCEPGFSSCSELASAAECVAEPASTPEAFGGVCEVRCAADAECSALGHGYACRSGACRAEPEALETDLSPLGSARQPLVRAVDSDTCLSSLRWVGGDRPSAEMHPGSDCVACHGETDSMPLMFAGTVYAFRENQLAHTPEAQPLDGCFGLEGIEVEITEGDGRVRSTLTNRAGNFYFEGRQSELVWPYTASLSFSRGRRVAEPRMFTSPYYGGCARCHYLPTDAPPADLLLQDRPLDENDDANAELIAPASAVIYAPGFYDP
jgi:hypothetical protein